MVYTDSLKRGVTHSMHELNISNFVSSIFTLEKTALYISDFSIYTVM